MSAVPLPLTWSPGLSALAKAKRAPRDPRFELLRSIVDYVEGAIVAGLRGVTPEQAAEAAEDLFRREAGTWSRGWHFAAQLAAEAGLVEDSKLEADVASFLARLPHEIRERLPKLPPTARRDLRATLLLMATAMGQIKEELPLGSVAALAGAMEQVKSEPVGIRLMALLECLFVIGERGGVPAKVVDALALALWRLVRRASPEDLVEDAYLSAVAMEAKERRDRVVAFRPATGRPKLSRRKTANGS